MVDVVVAVEGRGGGKDRLYWSPVLVGEGLGEKPNAREEIQQCRCKATRKTSRYMRSAGTRLAVSPTPGCCQCGCTGHVDSHIMWVTCSVNQSPPSQAQRISLLIRRLDDTSDHSFYSSTVSSAEDGTDYSVQ